MKTQQSAEHLLNEMGRLSELKGANLEAFAPTFNALARPAFEALLACRDHWKASFENERENVKRLRRLVYDAHNSDDPAVSPCRCYDCNLMRGITKEQKQ